MLRFPFPCIFVSLILLEQGAVLMQVLWSCEACHELPHTGNDVVAYLWSWFSF